MKKLVIFSKLRYKKGNYTSTAIVEPRDRTGCLPRADRKQEIFASRFPLVQIWWTALTGVMDRMIPIEIEASILKAPEHFPELQYKVFLTSQILGCFTGSHSEVLQTVKRDIKQF